jgi:hypothetical protein
MIIYIVRNLFNGKCYIGKTKGLDRRWAEHVRDARAGSRNALHRALMKYGKESFSLEVVCEGGESEIDFLESFCIVAFGTRSPDGYNLTDGGDGVIGYVFTAEDRKKLGSGLRGKKRPPMSDEWRENLRTAAIKNWEDPEWAKRCLEANALRSQDPKWRASLFEAAQKYKNDPVWLENIRKAAKRNAKNPSRRAKMQVHYDNRRSTPEWSEKMTVRSANPEWKKKQKEGAQKRSQSPEWKENHRKMCADPEYRKKLSEAQKRRQQIIRDEKALSDALIEQVRSTNLR